MAFWNKTKRQNAATSSGVKVELVTDQGNGFYSWHGELYRSDIIRSCIRPTARAIGKLVAKHIREDSSGLKVNPEAYMRVLLEEPNPLMSGQMFQEKLITQLMLNNNAFALIVRDDYGYPYQIYPIPCISAEAIYKNVELYIKFQLKNGKIFEFPYRDIIHLRQDFHSNDIFGEQTAIAINDLMDIIYTTDQGTVKAIKNSNVIKWLLKFKQILKPDDVKTAVKDFIASYMSIDGESGGAAASDAKYDLEQVKPESYVPDARSSSQTLQRVYSFFNTNEKIVQSKYTENEWISFFESTIEPISLQMSNEFSRKLFSPKERGFGNKIIFEASNLAYASMQTKLSLVQLVDRGAMTPNEWRAILNYAPLPGGDEPIRRLDTAVVNQAKNNNHQKEVINKDGEGEG
ncbi:phage portal protein [Niallia sp. Man26]|uniref:phage portal protein n=1 Tax=Niallia sp. Man26 TaxID=2912824 RepID=UPI001EDA0CFA|nr:phage portal protein [Niallia sp. Man26]UPO88329.1 phage portal protein [Niallia sp. Man26]